MQYAIIQRGVWSKAAANTSVFTTCVACSGSTDRHESIATMALPCPCIISFVLFTGVDRTVAEAQSSIHTASSALQCCCVKQAHTPTMLTVYTACFGVLGSLSQHKWRQWRAAWATCSLLATTLTSVRLSELLGGSCNSAAGSRATTIRFSSSRGVPVHAPQVVG